MRSSAMLCLCCLCSFFNPCSALSPRLPYLSAHETRVRHFLFQTRSLLVLANASSTANAISDNWNRSSTSGFFVVSFSIVSCDLPIVWTYKSIEDFAGLDRPCRLRPFFYVQMIPNCRTLYLSLFSI